MLGGLVAGAVLGGLASGLLGKKKMGFKQVPIAPLPKELSDALPTFLRFAGENLGGFALWRPYQELALKSASRAGTIGGAYLQTPFGILPAPRLAGLYQQNLVSPLVAQMKFLQMAMEPARWGEKTLYAYENFRRQQRYIPYEKSSFLQRFAQGALQGAGMFITPGMFGGGTSAPMPPSTIADWGNYLYDQYGF